MRIFSGHNPDGSSFEVHKSDISGDYGVFIMKDGQETEKFVDTYDQAYQELVDQMMILQTRDPIAA